MAGTKEFLIPFDATTFPATGDQFYTGFAVANLDLTTTADVTCTALDSGGNIITNGVPDQQGSGLPLLSSLPPLGHWQGYQFNNLIGQRGTIDCTSNTNIAATAFRYMGSNAFASLPVISK
jgi:hypothetical protein